MSLSSEFEFKLKVIIKLNFINELELISCSQKKQNDLNLLNNEEQFTK